MTVYRTPSTIRIDRRELTKRALALGLAVPALGAGRDRGRAAARQEASPAAFPEIGEEVDLANLSPQVAAPSEPVTITFASWVADESAVMQGLRDEFQALFPTITVDFVSIPAEQFTDQLTTQIAGGNPPDAVFIDQSAVVDFASRNAFVDLTPYAAGSAAVKQDDYVEAFLSAALYEQKLFALPYDGESTGLFYRTDFFAEAGIAAPPATWEEFEAAAQALTTGDRSGFIMFAPEAAYYWYPWLWQNGGEILSPDGQEIRFNSDAAKEAAAFYVGLAEYAPADFLNSNSYDGRVAFATGQVGMYVAGAWFAAVLDDEFPDIKGKWATAPLPQRQRCATTIAGDALALPAQGRNHDAAWKWIEFLSAPRNLVRWTLGTPEEPGSLLPTRTSLLEDPRIFEVNPILRGFAEQMACGVVNGAPNPRYGEVEVALNDALGRAIYGEIDAATALDEAALEGQDILAG